MRITPPIRFLAGTLGLWVGVRAAMLAWPQSAGRKGPTAAASAGSRAPRAASIVAAGPSSRWAVGRSIEAGRYPEAPLAREHRIASFRNAREPDATLGGTSRDTGRSDDALPGTVEGERRADVAAARQVFLSAPVAAASGRRWSGDAYLFVRGEGGDSLAPGGQLGGGQVFARLRYRLTDGVAATVRASRALRSRDGEVAIGIAWQPVRGVRLLAERRIAVERGGRDAWSALAAGGVDARHVGPLRLDAYAQAGVVGLRARDPFADGAVRLGREMGRLTVGAGAWAAAQPGAARLDLGPQLALRLPAGPGAVTLALDGRLRVAGDARPGSGLTLTAAAGF